MNGDQRIFRAAIAAIAAALAISLAAPALAATPTQPVLRDVFVTPRASLVTSPTVTVQWNASTDASGDALVYDVYRDVIPITGATIISRGLTPVASGLTGTSAQINAASAETTQSYVWFYAVVARDSLGMKSAPSFNMAPNVHGNRSDPNQVSCPRCHQVHGAYRVDYHLKEACYYCHGSTGANFATGAKSTYNTEASFFDTGTVTAGSKHRNAYMTSTKQECTACHTPHRSPFFYDAAGVYQASQSYRRMLRIEYATNTYEYYSRNDNPGGNSFCFSCHGSTAVIWNGKTINAEQAMGIAGGTSAYANAGGDHNYAGYASAAHGPSTVLTNTTEPNPGIQCLACHNKHASRADKLVDYRSQNTTASQTGGADICFACHSATSTDTRIAGSAAPFSWNGRDVKAQFTNTATYISRHPYQIVPATTGSLTCANCHNVHYVGKGTAGTAWSMARASDPDNTKLAAPSSPTDFCLRCHDGAAAPATTTATSIVPYSAAFRDVTAPFFPGWNKAASGVDFASSGHKATTIQKLSGQFGCQTCHDPHASRNQRLTAITQIPDGSTSTGHLNVSRDNSTTWSEQALCYGCHDGRRSGTCSSSGCHNTDMSWLNVSGAFSQTYRHPVERSGRHTDTETASQLGASNRHAECVDCHDPHAARRGRHTTGSSLAGEVLRGATGVKPTAWPSNWTAVPSGNWTTERLSGGSSDYEAYLCLKCHSSYSGQPFTATRSNNATYTSTDQALEFNPSNFSYHNVLGQSTGMQSSFTFVDSGGTTRNVTWAVPTVSFFVSGSSWTVNSMMTCTECHTNSTASAKGPHGSSVSWLLDPNYTDDWKTAYLSNTTNGMSSTTIICAKCHDLNGPSGTWSNNVHSAGGHQGALNKGGCILCHIKIPHGWKRPRLLVRVTADGTYAGSSSGLTAVLSTATISLSNGQAQWDPKYCETSCSKHNETVSPYWP